ncbi:recombinase, partial [Moraxella catarrhalis]|nr:recombinase [Moraxella catarrhalis]
HIAKGTVATKHPAMSAAAIASSISGSSGKNTPQLAKLAEFVVDILRTQFIAILGNISAAMPVALLIALAWGYFYDTPMIDGALVAHLWHDLDPIRSLALPHAAIAGVFLFVSGLVAGYYDNLAAYNKIG